VGQFWRAPKVDHRKRKIGQFIAWCETRSLTKPTEVTKPIIEAYQRHLFHRRLPSGKPLSFGTQLGALTSVKAYFKWLARSNVILWNPASEIEMPKTTKRLPRHVLTQAEVESILAVPDIADPLGLRDRAILETLYSTGLRRGELIKLSIYDVDAERGTVMVREGKGSKDRVVPIGERALAWIAKYTSDVRADLLTDPTNTVLFVSRLGDAMTPGHLTLIARKTIKASNIGKTGSCHMFRHACAVLMMEGGADVRMIQALLGHASLDTTSIYTTVAIRQLKAVHEKTHPGAMLGPRKPEQGGPKRVISNDEQAALLASLAEEPGAEREP
jgi:integrase/recombinase XerD